MKPSPPGQCPASTVTFRTRPPLYGMTMKPSESPGASPRMRAASGAWWSRPARSARGRGGPGPAALNAHGMLERLRGDLGDGLGAPRVELDGPDRVRRADEQDVVVLSAKGEVRGLLRHADLPDQLAGRTNDMHAVQGADVDIARTVEPHPIGKSRSDRREDPLVGDPLPLVDHVEGIDRVSIVHVVGPWPLNRGAVDDVEDLLIGREGDPVGHLQVSDDRLERIQLRIKSINVVGEMAVLGELQAAVARIGEPQSTIRFDDEVIGWVEGFSFAH